MRLDQAMQQQGLAASRSAAARLIQAGVVSVDGVPVDKAALDVGAHAQIAVAPSCENEFVSRAGAKLQGVLRARPAIRVQGYWVDFGQSTGGFSDCLLHYGAQRVLGFDVGQAQLHPRLKADARVRSVEGVNLRHPWPSFRSDAAKLADLKAFDALWPDSGADGVVIDVSFIGLRYVLDQAIACLAPGGWCVALIKPQFELGADPSERKRLFKDGVIRDRSILPQRLAEQAEGFAGMGLDFDARNDLIPSLITGQSGNQEYFLIAKLIPTLP
ncbi:MAG: TlyA family rRNA (cytidine-2'-O)-methyltransferase [Betaproteobacteria bacterium]|nr:TlyA family rRNA (cytidine-2'-O)-methyltransferase [Betaproteobacteria bacterium]